MDTSPKNRKAKVLILFGEAGAGKNYVGLLLKRMAGYHFWDGDEALTPQLRACLQTRTPFTMAMRDQFLHNLVMHIQALSEKHPHLVVAQGLYKESNRVMLQQQIPAALFVQVTSSVDRINKRLNERQDVVDAMYAAQLRKGFESPVLPHLMLVNDTVGEASLIDQLKRLGLLL